MRRLLTTLVVLGATGILAAGLPGCGDEAKVEKRETVSSPTGTTTTKEIKEIKSTGSNPPANSEGNKVEPK